MAELERELTQLGRHLEFPDTPDLVGAVREHLRAPSRRWWPQRWWRVAVVALAAVVVAIGVTFAVPPARTAILRVFGVGSVRIELVDKLPETAVSAPLDLGERVTLAEARRRAEFTIAVPSAGGFDSPDGVYVSGAAPGGFVSLLYGSAERPRAVLSEFEGVTGPLIDKSVGPGTRLEQATVDGRPAYWLAGAPHTFVFLNKYRITQFGTLRLARNTLVWERNGVTFRLEGDLTKDEAVEVASSLTPLPS
jgi:hypothetical protein